ncbi:hypothetical protein LC612_42710 [Nostoc sp. CHAB 5834]|nr:hypothetical protein [Nostoc sp. CHAB 5834]
MFDSIDEAFCTIKVLFNDQGKAVNYRFLGTNQAFLRQTGLVNVIGQRALDFVPELEPRWFDTYGHVVKMHW